MGDHVRIVGEKKITWGKRDSREEKKKIGIERRSRKTEEKDEERKIEKLMGNRTSKLSYKVAEKKARTEVAR